MKRLNAEPSLREAVARVVASLEGPVTRAELAQRVQALRPAPHPHLEAQILSEVRRHASLIRLEDGRFAAPHWVLRGVVYRFTPSAPDAQAGILPLFPCFIPFLLKPEGDKTAKPLALRDDKTGDTIPWLPFELHGALHDSSAESAVSFHAIVLRDWMISQGFVPGDSLLFRIEDAENAVFRVAREVAADTDRASIAIQDATLEAILVTLVEKHHGDQLFLEEIIPEAFARLNEAARAYPGSHWHDVVKRSPSLRLVDDYAIARATYLRPIDRLIGYTASPAAQRRLETRIDDCCAEVSRVLSALRVEAAPVRPAGRSEALNASTRQITRFLGTVSVSADMQRCLAVPAVYLARHEGVSLAEADTAMMCRFLLSFYPRRILFNRKTFTTRMLSALRHFYEVQDTSQYPQAASLPRVLSRLHALTDRKVALLAEIDQEGPDTARLFARLFPDADKDDAEMLTLSFAEPVPQN